MGKRMHFCIFETGIRKLRSERYLRRKMKFFSLLSVLLTLENHFILTAGGSTGRALQVDAHDYHEKYKGKLQLGDCPTRELTYPNGTTKIITCPYKFTGDPYFIPVAQSDFEVKRIMKAEDVTSRIGGGIGIGAGVMGLVSVKVKAKAVVDTQTSKKQLTLFNAYRMQRGVMTLRNAKPERALPSEYPTQLYLSEIILGGEETLLVTIEFESEKKRTEVEMTVTVKILWISISAKMRHITDSFRSAAAAKVTRLSTWREPETQTFVGLSSLQEATKAVEKYENEIRNAPSKLLQLPLEDKSLFLEYHFSLWGKPSEEMKFNEALANSHMESIRRQTEELETVANKIDAYLNYANRGGSMTRSQREDLRNYKVEIEEKLLKLTSAHSSYFLMGQREREEIPAIYGHSKAPFYYTRKLDTIFQPGEDFTYLDFTY